MDFTFEKRKTRDTMSKLTNDTAPPPQENIKTHALLLENKGRFVFL